MTQPPGDAAPSPLSPSVVDALDQRTEWLRRRLEEVDQRAARQKVVVDRTLYRGMAVAGALAVFAVMAMPWYAVRRESTSGDYVGEFSGGPWSWLNRLLSERPPSTDADLTSVGVALLVLVLPGLLFAVALVVVLVTAWLPSDRGATWATSLCWVAAVLTLLQSLVVASQGERTEDVVATAGPITAVVLWAFTAGAVQRCRK